jgi:Na+/H+ antiporter NhaD/arsenite permease-like protein
MDFAFFAVIAVLQVCFGPGFLTRARRRALNDEHTRALQHSAAMFGYPLCVILMCAVLCAMAIRPQWGFVVTPGAIAAAVILPGLYFLIRQWRAGRDG